MLKLRIEKSRALGLDITTHIYSNGIYITENLHPTKVFLNVFDLFESHDSLEEAKASLTKHIANLKNFTLNIKVSNSRISVDPSSGRYFKSHDFVTSASGDGKYYNGSDYVNLEEAKNIIYNQVNEKLKNL